MEIKTKKFSTKNLMTMFKIVSALSAKDFIEATKVLASVVVDGSMLGSINGMELDTVLEKVDTESLIKLSASVDVIAKEVPFESLCAILCNINKKLNTKMNISKRTEEYIKSKAESISGFDISCDNGELKITMI